MLIFAGDLGWGMEEGGEVIRLVIFVDVTNGWPLSKNDSVNVRGITKFWSNIGLEKLVFHRRIIFSKKQVLAVL